MPSWSAVPKSIQERFQAPPKRAAFHSDEDYEEARGYWQSHVGRSVAFAMQAHRERPRRLIYRIAPHNGGLVFAEPERAILIARIHETLRTAKTWRDLRDALPAQEFSTIAQAVTGREELLAVCYEFPFDPESIPGWVDGDYPPWLQQELESVLPREIISAFAKQVHTAVNGTYWHISEIDRPAVVNSLTKLGFTLDFEPEMPFH